MNAVGARFERHVDMIVDDQGDGTKRRLDRSCERDLASRVAMLVAQLRQGDATGREFLRQIRQGMPAGILRIQDGVEPKVKLV